MATAGYKYLLGIHMGICRGPIDSLVEIQVGDTTAWPIEVTVQTGGGTVVTVIHHPATTDGDGTYNPAWDETVTTVTDPIYTTYAAPDPVTTSSTIDINAPNIFGGDTKEGGIVGPMALMMGEPTQQVNPDLAKMLGGYLVSAFRGMVTAFYDGLVATLSPYPKPWKFRVRRALKGWDNDEVFYPDKAIIALTVYSPLVVGGTPFPRPVSAMNPAHIIWECLTNRDWGRGLNSSFLDAGSFTAAADTLFTEGFGLCLRWTRQDTVDAFVQTVINHIAATLYVSKVTGLITLELIRSDYVVDDLPLFTTSTGILSVEEDDSAASQTLTNEIIVTFTDPITGTARQVRAQNIASVQATGAILSMSTTYEGLPTAELAVRVAQRDLRINSAYLRRMKYTMDRKAYLEHPGSVFRFSDPARGIINMVMRVGRVEDTTDSTIIVVAVQDVFGLPTTSFVGVQPPVGTQLTGPVNPAYAAVAEASYMDMLRVLTAAEFAALTQDEAFLMMMAAQPMPIDTNYQMYTGSSSIGFRDKGVADWTPAGLLLNQIFPFDQTLYLRNLSLPSTVTPGTYVQINDEILRVDNYNPATNILTASRGCGDTIPKAHNANSLVWFPLSHAGYDPSVYVEGETVGGKFLTNAPGGQLSPASATLYNVALVGRIARPYPPARVFIGTANFYDAAPTTADFTVNWASRNRVTQADSLVPHLAPTVTPEVGQTAKIVLKNGAGAAFRTVAGITSNTWSYTTGDWATDGSPDPFTIELSSERDVFESWQKYSIPVSFAPPAPPPPPPPPPAGVPTYADESAVQPSFVPGGTASGDVLVADFGIPVNAADTYTFAWMRDGVDIVVTSGVDFGTTASTSTGRTLLTADTGHIISLRLHATNVSGDSEDVTIPGVLAS